MSDGIISAAGPFTLRLTAIAHGGEALGRHAGKVVFVPFSIPGELVRVQVVQEKDRWARAELLEVLEIDLPRPRNQLKTREDPQFLKYRHHIYKLIREETAKQM